MPTTQTIPIDLNTRGANPVAFTHQGDTARAFAFEVYNNGEEFALTGYTAKIGAILPADRGYTVIAGDDMATGSISENTITATLPAAYTAKAGHGLLTIILTGSGGTLRPINIDLRIQKSADAEDVIAGASDFPEGLEEIAASVFQEYLSTYLPPVAPSSSAAANKAADAKLTGEALDDLKSDLSDLRSDLSALDEVKTASAAAQMTDTGAIYMYTGTETGMVQNALYYYNGTAWVQIGKEVVVDTTLTQSGVPADAKATGDRLTPLETIIFGGTGEVVATTYVKSRPAVLGLTDTSSTRDGRLISDYISGKVKITAVETINFLVVQYDMLGAFEGIIMPDGSLNNTKTVVPSTMYSQGEIIIPAGKQGRIMARKGTKNNIALTDADSILIYKATASITDMVTEQAVSSLAYPNLYGKNLAALGDSLLEWSNKWVTQSATRFQMPTYIRGVGSQYWFCNSNRPNGAVYQVDTLIASDFVPDIVILEYGTNDVWTASGSFGTYATQASQSATTSVGAMRYCIETLQEEYPDCKILVLLPMMRNNNGLEPTAQTTFRALAKQVLADYSVQWVDMYETSGIVYDMMNPDGIHLMKTSGNYRVEGTGLYKYADRVERALVNL